MTAKSSTPKPGEATPGDEAETLAALLPVAAQIRHFLDGNTNGRALLRALYGAVLDEPVPEMLKRLLPKQD